MSIWDYMKPAAQAPTASGLALRGPRTLVVTWADGGETPLPARLLRQRCPCAACVDEWTHARTLKPDSVPDDVELREVSPVGNYAAQLSFSDGHASGIFTWPLLRTLAGEAALSPGDTAPA